MYYFGLEGVVVLSGMALQSWRHLSCVSMEVELFRPRTAVEMAWGPIGMRSSTLGNTYLAITTRGRAQGVLRAWQETQLER